MGCHDTRIHRNELFVEQNGICAWPPCRKPLSLTGPNSAEVDHNHRCCDREARTCGKCVRGLVHKRCNMLSIHNHDLAIEGGSDIPAGPIRDYLFVGEVNCRGESYLEDGEYNPEVVSAEDFYLYESEYRAQEIRLRREYPYFTAQILDGLSIVELRQLFKATPRQVTYRLAQERESFSISRATVFRRLREEKDRFINEAT
jgi:hypothetical protein